MRKFTKNVTILILMFLLVGCNQTDIDNTSTTKDSLTKDTIEQSYHSFKSKVEKIKEDFTSEAFIHISPEKFMITTTSFPKNQLDNRKIDAINDNIELPTRYETYYKSKDNHLLVKVNFIYYPESRKNGFVAINSISPTQHSNFSEGNDNIKRPLIDEYILSLDGYLVLINFIDVNLSNKEINESYYSSFISLTLKFYNDFEKALLAK